MKLHEFKLRTYASARDLSTVDVETLAADVERKINEALGAAHLALKEQYPHVTFSFSLSE